MKKEEFKEKLKDKLEDIWYDIQDFFEECGKTIIAIIVTIVLVFGLIFGSLAIFLDVYKKDSIKQWNNGICTECGGKYELYTISRGNHYYICETCGHEICCMGGMK